MISGRIVSGDWADGLAALPVDKSDVVLIGGVMDAKAHLSNDKTGIYSDFSVQVEEVLKDRSTSPVTAGSFISIERFGGAVRFPSGVIQTYETTGQGMPRLGGRYIFFLTCLDKADFAIITGYELDGQKVLPLDGATVEEGTRVYPFDTYQGFDVSAFLQLVRTETTPKT